VSAVRIALLATSIRVPPGLLTATAWDLVRAVPVACADPDHPQLPALREAGVEVALVSGAAPALDGTGTAGSADGTAAPADWPVPALRGLAEAAGADQVVWLLDPAAGWPGPQAAPDAALRALAGPAKGGVGPRPAVDDAGPTAGDGLTVSLVPAVPDVPGAALLDAVAVMDRLRSPGGCPWDAEQTHASLAPYLLEEAYEAYQAIEDADPAGLREELGDVLMQVLFHARVAAEAPAGRGAVGSGGADGGGVLVGFDVDEVADVLVAKLVRRHPHVFGDVVVGGSDEVLVNWDAIKAVEKSRRSVTEGVPLTQAALSLAAKLQKRADRIGVPADLVTAPRPGTAAAVVADLARSGDTDERRIGDLLFAAVALAAAADVDPEAALRGVARAFRDRLAAAEESALVDGIDPGTLDADGWRSRWPAA
jgi:XTP/dITP diphosphohydrolase